jgi:hypothetical protein
MVGIADIAVGSQEKSAGAAGRVGNSFIGLRLYAADNGCNQCTGGKVLTGTALGISSILFQQALADIAFDVDTQQYPGFVVDHLDQFI